MRELAGVYRYLFFLLNFGTILRLNDRQGRLHFFKHIIRPKQNSLKYTDLKTKLCHFQKGIQETLTSKNVPA
jgi:hypothetical protein